MKESYFKSRGDYAHYMALMKLADEESVPSELILADMRMNKIKMDIGQKIMYGEFFLGYYCRSLWKGYPKKITMTDRFNRLTLL